MFDKWPLIPVVDRGTVVDLIRTYLLAARTLLVVAISAGSIIVWHINGGGFWIVSRSFTISVPET